LVGVQLAISDAHGGLKTAIAKVLGCAWQRCTVHFLRDCFGHARKDQHGLLGALIRPIFAADSLTQARDRLSEAVAHLDGRLSRSPPCSKTPSQTSWPLRVSEACATARARVPDAQRSATARGSV